ncbi:MAG: hypothetical protein DMG58_13450 [Acidobacteria bacterium]|nr:MAG: hypothetical protein DMG58_13450 [Acidobacteriota bacterium]
MSTSSQFYTGADPSYFPAPEPGRKSGRRNLIRVIAGPVTLSLIGSIVMVVVGMRLLWQTPAAPTQLEVPAQKQTRPAAHLAFSIQEPEIKHSGRRHESAARTESESPETQTARLKLPSNPQLQQIILEAPPLLPPFPTENNVTIGTPRARLVRAFGKPDLRARTIQQERLIETYVYEQQDRATLVLIQDGSVISAHTGQPLRVRVLPSEPEPDN